MPKPETTYTRCHLGPQFSMEQVIAHGNEVVALGVEAHCLVERALLVGRAHRPQAPQDFRVVCDKLVGADTDERTCVEERSAANWQDGAAICNVARLRLSNGPLLENHCGRPRQTVRRRSVRKPCSSRRSNVSLCLGFLLRDMTLPYFRHAALVARCRWPLSVLRSSHHLLNPTPGGPGMCRRRFHEASVEAAV